MTSRERLLTALACGIPDRVPINTYELAGYHRADWYNRQPSYARLMQFIRDHTDCITNWGPGSRGDDYISAAGLAASAYPTPKHVHTETFGRHTRTTTVLHSPKGELRHVAEVDPDVYTTWNIEHWCKTPEDVDKVLSIPFEPLQFTAEGHDAVRSEIGEHGIIMASLADPAYAVADLMSFQDYILWLAEDPQHFARAVGVFAERMLINLENSLQAATVDLYRICGPEYMTPPYARPEMFRRFMVPHVKAMTGLIHRYGGKVRLHCHGRIAQVLDMFFETGCDGIDPCEPPPDGDIELDEVKRRCMAHGVSVWGNIELKVLEHGSRAQVRENVRRMLDQAKAGGGYVILPTAAPINIPLAAQTETNYRVMIETALEFGEY